VIIVITVVILVVIIIVTVVGAVDFMPATSKNFAVVDWQLPNLFLVSDCSGSGGMTGVLGLESECLRSIWPSAKERWRDWRLGFNLVV
jgi:hypothetical protein